VIVAYTLFLVFAFAAVVIVTLHELFEHNDPPQLPARPGSDAQWSDMADAMRRYRKHKARGRRRG
jgi:hypothetical protein